MSKELLSPKNVNFASVREGGTNLKPAIPEANRKKNKEKSLLQKPATRTEQDPSTFLEKKLTPAAPKGPKRKVKYVIEIQKDGTIIQSKKIIGFSSQMSKNRDGEAENISGRMPDRSIFHKSAKQKELIASNRKLPILKMLFLDRGYEFFKKLLSHLNSANTGRGKLPRPKKDLLVQMFEDLYISEESKPENVKPSFRPFERQRASLKDQLLQILDTKGSRTQQAAMIQKLNEDLFA